MILEFGDEAGDIDDGHVRPECTGRRPRHRAGPVAAASGLTARMVDARPSCSPLLDAAAAAIAPRSRPDDWGTADTVPGQHLRDLVADAAALDVLVRAGRRAC